METVELKKQALEMFRQINKAPSDILINDLNNTYLNTVFGEAILDQIRVLSKRDNFYTELVPQLFALDGLKCGDAALSGLTPIVMKKDLLNLVLIIKRLCKDEIKNKFGIVYIWMWDLYQRWAEHFNVKNQVQKRMHYILQSEINPKKRDAILKAKLLSALSLTRWNTQPERKQGVLVPLSLQQCWEITFSEPFPKCQKIKSIERKKRVCQKPYKPRDQSYGVLFLLNGGDEQISNTIEEEENQQQQQQKQQTTKEVKPNKKQVELSNNDKESLCAGETAQGTKSLTTSSLEISSTFGQQKLLSQSSGEVKIEFVFSSDEEEEEEIFQSAANEDEIKPQKNQSKRIQMANCDNENYEAEGLSIDFTDEEAEKQMQKMAKLTEGNKNVKAFQEKIEVVEAVENQNFINQQDAKKFNNQLPVQQTFAEFAQSGAPSQSYASGEELHECSHQASYSTESMSGKIDNALMFNNEFDEYFVFELPQGNGFGGRQQMPNFHSD